MVEALKLVGPVVVVITELVLEDDALQLVEILADVVEVDGAVEMTDLVPVEVSVELNKVVTVKEAVKLADVAPVVVAERDREVDLVQQSGVMSQWSKL